jgi:hypothetical protein
VSRSVSSFSRAASVAKRFAFVTASLALVAALASGATAVLSGCDQSEGDRCQTNKDCSDGLLCNQATQSCARSGGGDIDATVPDIIDAPIEKDDAGVDTMPDPI